MPTRKTVQKKKSGNNNQTPLEAAVRDLIQSTAPLVQNQALFNQQPAADRIPTEIMQAIYPHS